MHTMGIMVTLDESSFWVTQGLGVEQDICIARHSIGWNGTIEIQQTETFRRRPPLQLILRTCLCSSSFLLHFRDPAALDTSLTILSGDSIELLPASFLALLPNQPHGLDKHELALAHTFNED